MRTGLVGLGERDYLEVKIHREQERLGLTENCKSYLQLLLRVWQMAVGVIASKAGHTLEERLAKLFGVAAEFTESVFLGRRHRGGLGESWLSYNISGVISGALEKVLG